MAALDGHRTAEQRSLVYHQRVAEKLLLDPLVLARARMFLQARLDAGSGGVAARYAQGWARLLEGPVDELVAFITSDTQVARDLRQASPFAGALEPRERWRLWREAGTRAASSGGDISEPR